MTAQLTPKDFTTDQEVRWCPGCGDYAILKAVRAALADIGRPMHEVVFVSGIGCAARFPYYIDTYGFHTIHGRAPAVATGLKLANPDVDVWVVGGDGDMLSIGTNHLLHTLRRDIDLNILLFNNAIYGLTKGQASPASLPGTRTPSTPRGSTESAADAALLALASGARFVARSADTRLDILTETLKRAHAHKGAALVEIFQNCIVYNDGVWGGLGEKARRDEKSIVVRHGEPLLFGAQRERALVWNAETTTFEIFSGTPDEAQQRATRFDEANFVQAVALARLDPDEFPVALGVIYCAPAGDAPAPSAGATLGADELRKHMDSGATWTVSPHGQA